jgi:hypothetical protein
MNTGPVIRYNLHGRAKIEENETLHGRQEATGSPEVSGRYCPFVFIGLSRN